VRHAARSRARFRMAQKDRGVAVTGTAALHVIVGVALLGLPEGGRETPPPTIQVELVAAPKPQPRARRAPEAVERPAETPPPTPSPPRRTSVSEMQPPPEPEPEVEREPAPRTTPETEPLPEEEPSTGDDPATVKIAGQPFPYPEYLQNLIAQIYRRWQRPSGNVALRAEVFFLVHRDGSISNLKFVARSGSFSFDLEAQGAIEAAGNASAFGGLPDGFEDDVLPVNFFFDPRNRR
jgi:outer membrane biosynthesis protein TonB